MGQDQVDLSGAAGGTVAGCWQGTVSPYAVCEPQQFQPLTYGIGLVIFHCTAMLQLLLSGAFVDRYKRARSLFKN